MESLVRMHRYRAPKHRRNRLRRQRDGRWNHDHAIADVPRQEIDDFVGMLQEIQENRKRIKWKPEGPTEQKKFAVALRKAKFNHYEENSIASEKLLLQEHPHPLVIMTEKLHRHLNGRKIYAALQGWEDIYDAYEYQQDTDTAEEPRSEADDTPPGNAHSVTRTGICRDCCQRSWRCIRSDIFAEEEYEQTNRNNRDDLSI